MAFDFPTSPTDGQIYNNYYWDNTNSVWRLLSDSLEIAANFSNTATGTYTDGYDYKYLTFTASGSLTVTRGGYADVLVVGGGGGGGSSYGGGGGAGGMLYVQNAYLPAGSLEVNVGAGGDTYSDSSNTAFTGYNGEASSLWNYYAPGGGGGGGMTNKSGTSVAYSLNGSGGGSGGGAGGQYNTPGAIQGYGGTPTVNQGNTGGRANYVASGGGGGAGSAGADGSNVVGSGGGDGGSGLSNSITGSAVFYAGGGGGTSNAAGAQGSGGSGIGGDGDLNTATDGTANTGSGGGAASSSGGSGSGGSGIVIVRVRTN